MFRPGLVATLAVLSLLIGGTAAISAQAQDRPEKQRDRPPAAEQFRGDAQTAPSEERRTPGDEQRGPSDQRHAPAYEQRGPSEDRRTASADQRERSDERRSSADENRDDRGGDDAASLHRAHPHSAARCHDGFFTSTRDRGRACSKHGGIDIWLL